MGNEPKLHGTSIFFENTFASVAQPGDHVSRYGATTLEIKSVFLSKLLQGEKGSNFQGDSDAGSRSTTFHIHTIKENKFLSKINQIYITPLRNTVLRGNWKS